jgi:hypothetical protein
MSGGYTSPADGQLGELFDRLSDYGRRIRELERPTGTQTAAAVAQIATLVDELTATVNALAASGVEWAGPVNTTGAVTANTVTASSGINSIGAYSNLLTTSYRTLWVTSSGGTGAFGYVPSSRRFKQQITPHNIDPATWKALQLVTFRYEAAVTELGDNAATEVGLIAEEVHDLGLTWLVDYDDEGLPFGIKFERLALLLLPAVQGMEARLTALENA